MKPTFPHLRAGYFGVGPVLVACLFALTLTDIFWMPLLSHQHYPDPVAGRITWSDIDKSRDMRALLLLLGSAVVLALGITALGRFISMPDNQMDVTTCANQFLLFSLIPAAYRLAMACVNPINQVPPLRYLSTFPLGAVLALLLLSRYRKELAACDVLVLGGAMLLAPVMAGFSALGVLLAISRLWPNSISRFAPYGPGMTQAAVLVTIATFVGVFLVSPTAQLFRGRLLRLLMACQYPCVLLLLFLVPPPLVDVSHQFRNPYPFALVLTLGCAAIAAAAWMFRRFHSESAAVLVDVNSSLGRAVSPIAVMAITIFCICDFAGLPQASGEFFHWGETLAPWQQIWDCHCIPYVDFAPVHGMMEVATGALNQLFFDGSAANYSAAHALLGGMAVAALSLTASACISPIAAMMFVLALLPGDRFFFLAPGLFAIAAPRILTQPVRWLATWVVICIFSCGYNGAMGPAFALSTAPIALWQSWQAIKNQRWHLAALVAVMAALSAVVLLVLPLQIFSLAFMHFVLDNAWTNEAANGIAWTEGAWQRDRNIGTGTSQFLWEVVRFGWIPVLLGALVLNWKQWNKTSTGRSLPVLALSGSIALVLFWSSFWIIERLDPGYVSRPGAITDVAVYVLLPALALISLPASRGGLTTLLIAAFMGLLSKGLPSNIDPEVLSQRPFQTRLIPADASMIDGPALGIPRLGQIIKPDPDFTVNLLNLKKDLSHLLKPGETYFDLTNYTANYFYLDLPSPGQYAPYVAANSRLQAAMMAHVRRHPNVPAVLIVPSGQLDGVPMSLRCYRPYHDFVLKYTVYEADGFMFLVDPSRNPGAGPVGTEAQLQRLDTVFQTDDLRRLPMAWGDSFSAMRNRFETVASAPVTATANSGSVTSWTCEIPENAGNGVACDFLRLHCQFTPADASAYRTARQAKPSPITCEPQLALTWTARDGKSSAPIKLLGDDGDLLIPLGSYPRWLLGSGFARINITLANPRSASSISILNAEFLRLIPLQDY